ncbi:MAG: ATP-binding cassette domain-containing protein [Gammaproteobacteria bacterium]|jgi:osmoprotectant transport system ATP-binding protein|nr:ATP-binding cassette domain-containing protein [Gammaproteobacteria bacterium]MBT4492597.1 ATP-binding cassette domain-containing protein [Gammaproteobacteria bacterium]MBT7369737.1 ATP-binding cassette domain-containing protein [Gammaproteobacteria bacterium]
MTAIEFRNVTKAYGNTTVLHDFSLTISKNETTALVGESGSGKSTLLMLSNGLLDADDGSVQVMGEAIELADLVKLRRKMGYAVQGAGLFPHMTAAENISLTARLSGWSVDKIDQRLGELFALVELDRSCLDRFPHELSGGEQQRVSLCRALMLDPLLLLLDEPFSALDPLTRRSIHEEFLRIRNLGERSILLVTHDMQEAVKLAQHIVVLREGAVVQSGTVDEVVTEPADNYVRRLLGTST